MESVAIRTTIHHRNTHSINDGFCTFPVNTGTERGTDGSSKPSFIERALKFIGLSSWNLVDYEAATGESIANIKVKWYANKVTKFIAKNVVYLILTIGVLCLIYFSFPTQRNCIAKGNVMCKVKETPNGYANVIHSTNPNSYEYTETLDYKKYCKSVAKLSHSYLSVLNVNGLMTYMRQSDNHKEEEEDKKEDKPDTYMEKLESFINQNKNVKGTSEVDSVCTFDQNHKEYYTWISESLGKSRELFDLTDQELKGNLLHTRIFGKEGLWDVSKQTVVTKMLLTLDSGSSHCVCAHEHGFLKNIISFVDEKNQFKTMLNPSISTRSAKMMTIPRPMGGILSFLNKKVSVPESISVSYTNDYGYTESRTMDGEACACVLLCTNDDSLYQ